jgi:EAL domain-containing protein (putative c-di-GMP-specific phosphodiesterase class I)
MTLPSETLTPTCHELRLALERGELAAWYQPTVRLSDGIVCGFEALVRWHHPVLGLLPASAFIPLAEQCGLVYELDHWMRREVFRQLETWQEDVLVTPGFRMAVNISAMEICSEHLAADVGRAIDDAGVDPHGLVLELTETRKIDDLEAAQRSAVGLHDLGVELALDDFGSQYGTFELVRTLPFDVLKIDRTIVSASDTNAGRVIVAALVELANLLPATILAEGVETIDEADRLRLLGCDEAQGFLWMPAVSAKDAEDLLTMGAPLGAVPV